jgi:hypothetical protein
MAENDSTTAKERKREIDLSNNGDYLHLLVNAYGLIELFGEIDDLGKQIKQAARDLKAGKNVSPSKLETLGKRLGGLYRRSGFTNCRAVNKNGIPADHLFLKTTCEKTAMAKAGAA